MLAVEFTGNARNDFFPETCLEDPNGQNIAFPPSFPAGSLSGFDVDEICFVYDQTTDRFDVGVMTFNHAVLGTPVPFGDADGDGDPSLTGAALAGEGGVDRVALGTGEYFSLVLDFDNDAATPPDVIAGISVERSSPNGFRVSEVSLPHPGLEFSFLSTYYGLLHSLPEESSLFETPSPDAPHLEFSIARVSDLPGFFSVELADPDAGITLYFKAGSISDTVIGEEDFSVVSHPVDAWLDSEGDGMPDGSDTDRDNDGIPDDAERDTEGRDTDADGSEDFLDSDSDGDTILDLHEADTHLFDDDGDLEISPGELAVIDTGGNYPGGDSNGVLSFDELTDTDSSGIPDVRDDDSDGDGLDDAREAGDTLPDTPPVDSDGDGLPDYRDFDSDDDGLADGVEAALGTDATSSDTDGDGVPDGEEEAGGDDQLDPSDPSGGGGGGNSSANPYDGIWAQGGGCSLVL